MLRRNNTGKARRERYKSSLWYRRGRLCVSFNTNWIKTFKCLQAKNPLLSSFRLLLFLLLYSSPRGFSYARNWGTLTDIIRRERVSSSTVFLAGSVSRIQTEGVESDLWNPFDSNECTRNNPRELIFDYKLCAASASAAAASISFSYS